MFKIDNQSLPAEQARPEPAPRLEDLARQACDAHAATGQAVSDAVHYALTAGRALIAAKALVPEGEWVRWVLHNCNFTIRHAQRYMKLVSAYEADATRVSRDVCGLSLRGAIKRLTPPQPKANAPLRIVRSTTPTSGLDVSMAWGTAPPTERKRAIFNIGVRSLLAEFPDDCLPAVEDWVADRRRPAIASTTAIEIDENGFPELPDCLRRAPVTTH